MEQVFNFRKELPENLRPSWPKTTTITLTSCHLKSIGVTIDKTRIETVFSKMKVIPIYYGNVKNPFEWRQFYSDFYNQTSIGYTDNLSTKKVKIFPNGSLQIAGCADMLDCNRFICQLRFIMKMVYRVEIPPESFKIAMYNSSFCMNHIIDVYNLIDILNKKNLVYQYDPDRYSAVKVKIPMGDRKVTVSIFVTGSVLITGARHEDDISDVYITISKILLSEGIFIEENRKNIPDIYMGYPVDQWFS